MKVEFKRDLHHNFMVLSETLNNTAESYCIKMLTYQQIEGILPMEIQTINNQDFYYYEITAKQSMNNLFDKTVLSLDRVRKIFQNLMDTIEKSYDYLLLPDDFLLAPEYVYLDINTDLPYLCYLPGYQNNVKEQMSGFIEYIMNKVDYNDKEAVLLVYRLYAVSKEEGYTFHHLNMVIQNSIGSNSQGKTVKVQGNGEDLNQTPDQMHREQPESAERKEQQTAPNEPAEDIKVIRKSMLWKNSDRRDKEKIYREKKDKEAKDREKRYMEKKDKAKEEGKLSTPIGRNIPVMMEKIEGEQEVYCYPLRTYLLSAVSFLGGILLVVFCCKRKIIYNTFGNRIDYSKLFALLLILICLEGYLMKQIWDKKNRITKMVAKSEYIDPRQNFDRKSDTRKNTEFSRESELFGEECGLTGGNPGGKWIDHPERAEKLNQVSSWDWNEAKSEGIKDLRDEKIEGMEDLRNEKREGLKDLRNERMESMKSLRNGEVESMKALGNREVEGMKALRNWEADSMKDLESEESRDKKDRRDEKDEDIGENEDEEYNPTCLLNEVQPESSYRLEPMDKKQYETIPIKEFPFFIGKIKKNVDYCLEKDVVSRYHAKIIREQDQFYIADLNSTNGTFLNGELLQPYGRKEMKPGDEIAFANIKFIFR